MRDKWVSASLDEPLKPYKEPVQTIDDKRLGGRKGWFSGAYYALVVRAVEWSGAVLWMVYVL